MTRLLLLVFLALPVTAAADWDGIWTEEGENGYVSIHTSSDWIVVALLDADDSSWEALQGPFDGTTGTLSVAHGPGQASVEIRFTQSNRAVFTVLSCKPDPGATCETAPGVTFTLTKVF